MRRIIREDPERKGIGPVEGKSRIRREMIGLRRQLSEEDWITMSKAVAARFLALPEVKHARRIHLYLSMDGNHEVATASLFECLYAEGKELLVPVAKNGDLLSATWRPEMPVSKSELGAPEPIAPDLLVDCAADLVVLPVVAADLSGIRLGYGKGFYDRFLSRLGRRAVPPICVGLAFGFQIIERLPRDPWDEPLDMLVYEQGCYYFNSKRRSYHEYRDANT